MGDTMGSARVLAMLEGLHGYYRDPRYRPSPWLIRRARLGVPLNDSRALAKRRTRAARPAVQPSRASRGARPR